MSDNTLNTTQQNSGDNVERILADIDKLSPKEKKQVIFGIFKDLNDGQRIALVNDIIRRFGNYTL